VGAIEAGNITAQVKSEPSNRNEKKDDTPDHQPSKIGKRKLWAFRFIAIVILPLALFTILEVGLRLAEYGYPSGFFVPSTVDGREVLIENQKFGRRFFPAHLARTPRPMVLSPEKPAGSYRIFIFGESAAMGDPEPSFGLSRLLEVLLEDQFPATDFEVINAAMTAINSHVVREIAHDCMDLDGDLWLVYMGNNEVIGPYGAGTIFGERVPPLGVIRASTVLGRTRIGQLFGSFKSTASAPKTWDGLKMFIEQQVHQDDPDMARVHSHFKSNLDAIIRMGRESGAKVLVSTVAVNLKDCAPFGSFHREGLLPEEKANWEQQWEEGVKAEHAGRFDEALGKYREAEKIDAGHAELQYRLGRCLSALEKPDEARLAYESARDADTLHFRSDSGNEKIVRALVKKHADPGVGLMDAVDRLNGRSEDGIAGLEWFYEHVHFNFAGNHALAQLAAERITLQLPERIRKTGSGNHWLSPEDCAARLSYNAWHEERIISEINRRHQKPPYTRQMDHAERSEHWKNRLSAIRQGAGLAAMNAFIIRAKQAVADKPDDWMLHENLGRLLETAGRWTEAVTAWRRVADLVPQYANAFHHLGTIMDTEGKYDAARQYLEKALEIKPDMSTTMYNLGVVLVAQGQHDRAFELYAQALSLQPNDPAPLYNWGLALMDQRRYAEAIGKYDEAIRIDPTYSRAHFNKGIALQRLNRLDESAKQFEEVVRLNPGFTQARFFLGMQWMRQNRFEEAAKQLAIVARMHPDQAGILTQYGLALEKAGRLDEAIVPFREALRLQPQQEEAKKGLEAIGGGSDADAAAAAKEALDNLNK